MLVTGGTHKPQTLDQLLPPGLAGKLDRLDLLSRRLFAGKLPGERRSKRRGRSVEFDDFRDYTAGDDLRHIDWNVYARLDRLFIKLFREEEDLGLELLIDASPSMDAGERGEDAPRVGGTSGTPAGAVPTKLVFAHQLAMALAYIGLVNQNRVAAATFGHPPDSGGAAGGGVSPATSPASVTGLRRMSPVRGRTSLRTIANFLLGSLALASSPRPMPISYGSIFRTFSRRLGARGARGVLVVLTDALMPTEELDSALSALAAAADLGFDVYVLHVISPDELDPSAAAERGLSGDLRLTDIESGAAVEMTISPASIAAYSAALTQHLADVKRRCTTRGLAHILVRTDTPIDTLVADTFRRGGMLR